MARIISLLFILLILAFGLFFGVLNASQVELDYYLGTLSIPLSLVIVATLIIGALLGSLASVGMVLRNKRQIGKLRRQLDRASGNTARVTHDVA